MTRVALYTRVSTEEQATEGVSLAEQKERLKLWAKLEGWQIVEHYSDEGVSGSSDNRPELQRLMSDAKVGGFDLVAVAKLDRFMRNVRLLLNYIHELEKVGVGFASQSEGIDTRKPGIGKIMLALLGAIAEWERDRIGERIKNFRNHLAKNGRWSSGQPTFGYRFNKETKELEIYEPEAEVVRYIFDSYINSDLGILRVAEKLTNEQMLTPRRVRCKHNAWTQSTIRRILTHPGYKGGPNEDWQFKTPQIVDPSTWFLAQRRLMTNRHFKPVRRKTEFQGLLRCGLCSHTLHIAYDHDVRKYECPGRKKGYHLDGSPRCTLPRFYVEKLEASLKEQVINVFSNPEILVGHLKRMQQEAKQRKDTLKKRLHPLQVEIKRVEEDIVIADAKLEMRRIDAVHYKALVAELQAKQRNLKRRQKEADPLTTANYIIAQGDAIYFERLIDKINDWGVAVIAPMAIDSPREWMVKCAASAYVYPDHIELKGSLPLNGNGESDITTDYRLNRYLQSQ